jgi:hypothetical protein
MALGRLASSAGARASRARWQRSVWRGWAAAARRRRWLGAALAGWRSSGRARLCALAFLCVRAHARARRLRRGLCARARQARLGSAWRGWAGGVARSQRHARLLERGAWTRVRSTPFVESIEALWAQNHWLLLRTREHGASIWGVVWRGLPLTRACAAWQASQWLRCVLGWWRITSRREIAGRAERSLAEVRRLLSACVWMCLGSGVHGGSVTPPIRQQSERSLAEARRSAQAAAQVSGEFPIFGAVHCD